MGGHRAVGVEGTRTVERDHEPVRLEPGVGDRRDVLLRPDTDRAGEYARRTVGVRDGERHQVGAVGGEHVREHLTGGEHAVTELPFPSHRLA